MTASRLALAILLAPAAAHAGNLEEPATAPAPVAVTPQAPGNEVAFTLKAGVQAVPEYFGSEDYTVGPDLGVSQGYLNFGGSEFGKADPRATSEGLGFYGSFRYVPERSSDDYEELEGLEDVDAALELGGGLSYATSNTKTFADLRYGVTGHESLVAEVGADAVVRPSEGLTVRAGPRVLLGSDDYAQTYFGVSDEEAVASDFSAYEAGGGALSAGVEVGATYWFNDSWGVDGSARYDRFVGDAEESPIVEQGSKDQYSVSIGVTRRVSFGF